MNGNLTMTTLAVKALLFLAAPQALAHGFAGSGVLHPLTGWDHLLAMLAVGAWSAQSGGRALIAIPAGFVIAMAAGGAYGLLAGSLPATEVLIAVSISGLGLAIALGRHMAWPIAVLTTLLFGLAHGSAHGSEMPGEADAIGYFIGFLVTTAGLHVAGAVGALLVLDRPGGKYWLQGAGTAAAIAGVILVITRGVE